MGSSSYGIFDYGTGWDRLVVYVWVVRFRGFKLGLLHHKITHKSRFTAMCLVCQSDICRLKT